MGIENEPPSKLKLYRMSGLEEHLEEGGYEKTLVNETIASGSGSGTGRGSEDRSTNRVILVEPSHEANVI